MAAPKEKRLSYKQLTEIAEQQINEFMAQSRKAKHEHDKRMWNNFAAGVHLHWHRVALAMGCLNDEDAKRLHILSSAD
jgi:glucose-6-phosphate dehydrogenase assembly protein OpcA